jgi:hypothetical protein
MRPGVVVFRAMDFGSNKKAIETGDHAAVEKLSTILDVLKYRMRCWTPAGA